MKFLTDLSDDIKIDIITILLHSLKHDSTNQVAKDVPMREKRKRFASKGRSIEEWNKIFEGKDVDMSAGIDFSTDNFIKAHSGKIITGK